MNFCVWFRFLDLISPSQALSLRLKNLFFLVCFHCSIWYVWGLPSNLYWISWCHSLSLLWRNPCLILFDLIFETRSSGFSSLSYLNLCIWWYGIKTEKRKILLILHTDLWWIVVWGNLPSYFHITPVLNQSACYQHQNSQILWSLPNIPY